MTFIISPHIDDAVFSLGGFMLSIADKTSIQVLNVFSVSQWTNPWITSNDVGLTKERVTEIRKDEEKIVSKEIGYESLYLDFEDVLLRNPRPNPNIKQDVRLALLQIVSIEDLVIFPLGLQHPDHIIISEIGFELVAKGYQVLFYEDQPYVSTPDGYEERVAITLERNLDPVVVEIDLHRKISLMKLYRSQASDEWIDLIVNYAGTQGETRSVEKIWEPHDSNFSLVKFS